MVGRELHTICPNGEDHQGRGRGRRGGSGTNKLGNGRRLAGLRNCKPTTMMAKEFSQVPGFSRKGSLATSSSLRVLIWVLAPCIDGVMILAMIQSIQRRMIVSKMKTTELKIKIVREIKRKNWWTELWIVFAAHSSKVN